jgi:hypothetical protein
VLPSVIFCGGKIVFLGGTVRLGHPGLWVRPVWGAREHILELVMDHSSGFVCKGTVCHAIYVSLGTFIGGGEK